MYLLNGVLGFVHSPIHLGYAIEFDQPLIMAEALALTAVHDCHFGEVLTAIEAAASSSNGSESLINLEREIYSNKIMRQAMKYKHGVFQVRDGLLAHAKEEFMRVISLWKVKPEDLQEKTADCLNATGTILSQLLIWSKIPRYVTFEQFTGHHSPSDPTSRSGSISSSCIQLRPVPCGRR